MKRKLLSTVAVAAALGLGSSAHAVLFDFQDGNVINVGSFDWLQTSIGVEDGNQAILDFVSSGGVCTGTATNCEFTFLTHARLTAVTDVSGAVVTPSGLNSDYEITLDMSVTESVTNFFGAPGSLNAVAQFAALPNGEFLEIWYDTNVNSNDVQGFGFNDGGLILSGSEVGAATGLFSITDDIPVQLDQAPGSVSGPGTDDYGDGSGIAGASQLTVTGTGSNTQLPWDDLSQDNSFFLTALDTFGITFQNISVGLPFGTVDPSDCFTPSASGVAVGGSRAAGPCAAIHNDTLYAGNPDGTGFVPVVGNVNGAVGAPDLVLQSDYNSTFRAEAIPEPGIMVLMGMGLFGLGALRAKKSRA